MSFSSFDTLKTGTLRGGTGTASPVRGLRAMRDLRSLTLKVPNPRISMWWPCERARATALRNASTVSATSFLVRPVRSEIWSTISALVIDYLLARPVGAHHGPRDYELRGTLARAAEICQSLFGQGVAGLYRAPSASRSAFGRSPPSRGGPIAAHPWRTPPSIPARTRRLGSPRGWRRSAAGRLRPGPGVRG